MKSTASLIIKKSRVPLLKSRATRLAKLKLEMQRNRRLRKHEALLLSSAMEGLTEAEQKFVEANAKKFFPAVRWQSAHRQREVDEFYGRHYRPPKPIERYLRHNVHKHEVIGTRARVKTKVKGRTVWKYRTLLETLYYDHLLGKKKVNAEELGRIFLSGLGRPGVTVHHIMKKMEAFFGIKFVKETHGGYRFGKKKK